MFNRKNEPLSISHEFRDSLDILETLPFEWCDVEALERRHKIGQGSLILFEGFRDTADMLYSYDIRQDLLRQQRLPYLLEHTFQNMDEPIENNRVYLPLRPEPGTGDLLFWAALQASNVKLGCQFYEGVVAKKADSIYPMQLRSPDIEYPFWVKHRWQF